ncbi:molybdopterin-dependent oxidoreductase [Vibrio sp. SS-MA-C1-2]|uniref:molybdopterin-dependent oxidoreductase n=1 Tax=Vibrio sp. SS-MA-C1-2 TaxID=2908646 RepID=UPI001F2BFD98|nr:molybdopterin-dependent oxidoreductase [Vibrio sp. SS-MA-C1-2]UJF17342.1 molybdopterin-dependent oxidoreductase [Vibrio sp. SS-MA-C1-2]
MDRRKFLTGAAAIGIGAGTAAYGNIFARSLSFSDRGEKANYQFYGDSHTPEWTLNKYNQHKVNAEYMIKHSTCLQCHSECGIRAKVNRETGKLERLFGNPYHPNTLVEYIDNDTPIADTATTNGTLCARGNAGLQTAYDPYRLTTPLKRAGKRGSNEWTEISWEQLIKEVAHGGKIFADTTDTNSQNLVVKGFKDLYSKRDQWIDNNNHDLGRETNKFVLQAGRIVKSRKDFQTRFCQSFGTVNNFEHTNICELSHHIATGAVYAGKHNLKSDLCEAEFALFFGTAPGEANFPMQTMGKYSAQARANGCKIAVVDPVLPRTMTNDKNMRWIAPKPGTDGAIASGMLRWIIGNARYNANFLSRPNAVAAKQAGELNHTDASHLIITAAGHKNYGQFLTAKEAGIKGKEHVVIDQHGQPADAETVNQAQIEFEGTVNGLQVATSFSLMKVSVSKHSLQEYAEISGVTVDDIIYLANEFTSHGRKVAVELYRGIAQHPNGYATGFTIYQLNLMVGNLNWTGGASLGGGGLNYNSGQYQLKEIPGLVKADFGVHISREQMAYEDTVEFKNKVAKGINPYPAPRPWFPLTKDVFSEIIPSIIEGYPYKADILMWHMCTPFYSTPSMGRDEMIKAVSDPKNVPLILASDIVVGDSSMYADYIIPDLTYLEQYVHHPMMEATLIKGTAVRSPVIEPLTGKTADGYAMSYEQFLIDVAKELKMPGFGKNAIKATDGKLWPLDTMSDYYLKATANLAFEGQGSKDVSEDDLRITGLDSYYQTNKTKLEPHQWSKVLYVMSRGGRFESVDNRRQGNQLTHQYNGVLHTYNEKLAKHVNSQTGKKFNGGAGWQPSTTSSGTPLSSLDRELPFTILTRKTALQSHSRLASNTYIREINPTNWAEMNYDDGQRLGLKSGDEVIVETHEGKRKCSVKLRQGVAPNVITFTVGYGHWGYGATDMDISGKRIKGSKIRRAGVNLNPIMRTDPDVWGMPLMDMVGGSSCFFDTKAKIYKA